MAELRKSDSSGIPAHLPLAINTLSIVFSFGPFTTKKTHQGPGVNPWGRAMKLVRGPEQLRELELFTLGLFRVSGETLSSLQHPEGRLW